MNLQAEKLDVLQLIMNTDDPGLILDVKALLRTTKNDWYDDLSDEQQRDVIEGIKEADKGETITHSEAVKRFSKWGLR